MGVEKELIDRMFQVGRRALVEWKTRPQVTKAVEECAELSASLCKFLNRECDYAKVTLDHDREIVDEIADVIFMAFQMRIAFGVSRVDERLLYKINRTEKRLDEQMSVNSEGQYTGM